MTVPKSVTLRGGSGALVVRYCPACGTAAHLWQFPNNGLERSAGRPHVPRRVSGGADHSTFATEHLREEWFPIAAIETVSRWRAFSRLARAGRRSRDVFVR